MPEEPSLNLPTTDDLRLWRKERDRLVAEERAIKRRRSKLDKLIEAGAAFLEHAGKARVAPPSAPPVSQTAPVQSSVQRAPRRARGKSWTATIIKIVRKENRGMTYAEIKAAIAETHLGETLARTEKAFYGGIGKLAEKGEIIKHKGRVYTPLAYKKFMRDVEAGVVEDIAVQTQSGQLSPNKVVILETLSGRTDGTTTPEIIKSLLSHPDTEQAVKHNRTPVYNLLGRMVRREELIKRGGKYFLPSRKSETPGPEEPSVPNHHGDGNGSPSSSGGRESRHSLAALPDAGPAHSGV